MTARDNTKEELIEELNKVREENLLLKSVHKSHDIERILAPARVCPVNARVSRVFVLVAVGIIRRFLTGRGPQTAHAR